MSNLLNFNSHVVRLILIALLVSVLATSQTSADYSSLISRTASGAYSLRGAIASTGFDVNFTWRDSGTQPNYVAASPSSPKPAATYTASPPPSCAPRFQCLAPCWYEVLNNGHFQGTSCSPNWVFPSGYVLPLSEICGTSPPAFTPRKIVVLPYASGFSQNFSVPEDAVGAFDIALSYAIVGTPTANDRIVLELREGFTQIAKISIRTDGKPTYCHSEGFTFPSGNVGGSFAGRNLKLKVTSQIVTPGVEFHIGSMNTNVYQQ